MLLKRLIGVITVLDGWAVQSVGYRNYLPLGKPSIIAENFDRWQLDEIMVVDITRSRAGKGPNLKLIEAITEKEIMTPLCYVGGIRDTADALSAISRGADRVGVDNLFMRNEDRASSIADAVGRQAVIRVQPVVMQAGNLHAFDYLSKETVGRINVQHYIDNSNSFSELMLVDVQNEGILCGFNTDILAPFDDAQLQIICFGGITEKQQIKSLFFRKEVSAVAVGNSLSYQEIPNKRILEQTAVDVVRSTDFGGVTRGAREW